MMRGGGRAGRTSGRASQYVREIFHYLHKTDIHMYRMSSDFVPYLTHPDLPQFHHQLEEAEQELADLGALARDYDIRLSLHPSQYILLNAQDDEVARKSIADLNAQARLLDALGCGPEAVVVTHVGGVYDDREESLTRFIRRYPELPEGTRRRLVVENDDVSYSVAEVLRIHRETGCPVVFDNLHHFCLNPDGLPMREAFHAALATWPEGVTPKIHYSSPSTSFEPFTEKQKGNTGRDKTVSKLRAPRTKAHADFIDPMEFVLFWEAVGAARRARSTSCWRPRPRTWPCCACAATCKSRTSVVCQWRAKKPTLLPEVNAELGRRGHNVL